jgi:hypothetical protein
LHLASTKESGPEALGRRALRRTRTFGAAEVSARYQTWQRLAGFILVLASQPNTRAKSGLSVTGPLTRHCEEEWSGPFPTANRRRSFSRHWTPVHLDVVVDALEPAVQRLTEAGAALDRPIQEQAWGRMANLGDPFGHGLCVIEFRGKGYDEVLEG